MVLSLVPGIRRWAGTLPVYGLKAGSPDHIAIALVGPGLWVPQAVLPRLLSRDQFMFSLTFTCFTSFFAGIYKGCRALS